MAETADRAQAQTELGAPLGVGEADWDVEAFLQHLQKDGVLNSLRTWQKRKAPGQVMPVDDLMSASEVEDWDRWTSTEDAASTTTCTESDWGSERDLDSQQQLSNSSSASSMAAGSWGFKRLVGGASSAGPPIPMGQSDSCESLPRLDGPGSLESESIEPGGTGDGDLPNVVEDSELDDFLTELEQNENTAATPAAGWRLVMNKTTRSMQYCSWLRDPGSRGGTEYRGRFIVRGCSAESARDFFLDEAHRAEWDENRLLSQQLEDWDEHGCTAVRWVRKLPFFLKNREYVVARRVWNPEDRTFYCISRNANHRTAPLRNDTVRVSSLHSSWRIRPIDASTVEGGAALRTPRGAACDEAVEVITHYEEESGLHKDLARMGVAHGMWTYIQKMEQALHSYATSGRNAKHFLPVFLIQADARHGLLGLPRPLEQHHQEQLEQLLAASGPV